MTGHTCYARKQHLQTSERMLISQRRGHRVYCAEVHMLKGMVTNVSTRVNIMDVAINPHDRGVGHVDNYAEEGG